MNSSPIFQIPMAYNPNLTHIKSIITKIDKKFCFVFVFFLILFLFLCFLCFFDFVFVFLCFFVFFLVYSPPLTN